MWIGTSYDQSVRPNETYFGITVEDANDPYEPVNVSCEPASFLVCISFFSLDSSLSVSCLLSAGLNPQGLKEKIETPGNG
jgi:hypothetical protein